MSSVSDDDDSGPSLKEMVTKNLEANGILGKLQAQLRASVFLILEEEFQEKNIPIVNQKTNHLLSTSLGKVAVSLVQDFLQCLNLEFTLAVFCPETKSALTENSVNREYLHKELGCKPLDSYPYLLQLIEDNQNAQNKNIKTNSFVSSKESFKNLSKDEKTQENIQAVEKKEQESNQSVEVLNKNNTEVTSTESINTIDFTKKSENSSIVKEKLPSENKESLKKGVTLGSGSPTNTPNHTNASSNSNQSTNNNTISSISNNDQESEASDKSTLTKSSETDKSLLSGTEKYSEEEFSSVSETKSQTEEEEESSSQKEKSKAIKSHSKTEEEKSEIEEAVETAEDIEEDISSLDDLLSANSESSNKTKDVSASKEENSIVDYEESL